MISYLSREKFIIYKKIICTVKGLRLPLDLTKEAQIIISISLELIEKFP